MSIMRDQKIWGDGFVDDGWHDLVSVRNWSLVAPDEFVRLFPALVPRDGRVPDPVRSLVFARALAIEAPSRRRPVAGRFANGMRSEHGFSKSSHVEDCGGSLAGAKSDPQFLRDSVRDEINIVTHRGAERDMARFAYLASVHPAYVWPAASAMAYWGTTLAWLGALARCGLAMMPEEVAEHLDDLLAYGVNGATVTRDTLVGEYIERSVDLQALHRAVRQRRDGDPVIVRGNRPLARNRWITPSLLRLSERLVMALRSTAASGRQEL